MKIEIEIDEGAIMEALGKACGEGALAWADEVEFKPAASAKGLKEGAPDRVIAAHLVIHETLPGRQRVSRYRFGKRELKQAAEVDGPLALDINQTVGRGEELEHQLADEFIQLGLFGRVIFGEGSTEAAE